LLEAMQQSQWAWVNRSRLSTAELFSIKRISITAHLWNDTSITTTLSK
jgi:hypothetical protein